MIWTLAPVVLLEAALVASLLRKTTRATPSMKLRDTLEVSPRLWSVIGVLEGCAAVGLVAGLARPAVGAAAAYGTALLMLGAIVAHLRVRVAGRALLAPTVLLASAVVTGIGFSAAV